MVERRTRFEQFAILAVDLCARVDVMAAAMAPLKRMVGHSARILKAAPKAREKHSEKTQNRYAMIRARCSPYSTPIPGTPLLMPASK